MNILIIGNGFDLAHNLPTRYSNFLDWIKVTRKIIDENYTLKDEDWEGIDLRLRASMEKEINEANNLPFFLEEKWKDRINNNTLINYFLNCSRDEDWTGFETDMSNLIHVLEILDEKIDVGDSLNSLKISEKKTLLHIIWQHRYENFREGLLEKLKSNALISNLIDFDQVPDKTLENILDILGVYKKLEEVNMAQLRREFVEDKSLLGKNLKNSLEDLIKLLEKYLYWFCLRFQVDQISPDIEGIKADKVLSFNYTNTYERVYDEDEREIEYEYIHGKVQFDENRNNMVLGIEEYLPADKKDCNLKFIAFKKYYQRIYKGTGNRYKNWIYQIREDARIIKSELQKEFPLQVPIEKFEEEKRHHLYIFGHSLDAADGDVLRDFILNDNVYTTIYYFSEDGVDKRNLADKISNLVKVIGQDELIRRTSGNTKTIEFVAQKK